MFFAKLIAIIAEEEKLKQNILGLFIVMMCLVCMGCPSPVADPAALTPSGIVFADGAAVSRQFGSGAYTNAVSGVGAGAISYVSGTPGTATVNAVTGEVTLVAVGTTIITASKAATTTHEAVTNSYTLTVTALIPSTIVFADGAAVSRQFGSGAYTNAVSGVGAGAISYGSGTPGTATVNASTGEVTLVAVGTTIITASKAATATHEAVTNSYTLTVTTVLITFSGLSANGTSGSVPTSELTLTFFNVDPTTLTTSDISLSGATKGALSGSGTTRTLAISALTVANGQNVTVTLANPAGYAISPASKTVAIHDVPAVTEVRARGYNTKNTIKWTAVPDATSYNLYWATSPGVTKASNKISGVPINYSHTALTNGTIYYYVVTALNGSYESPISAEASANPGYFYGGVGPGGGYICYDSFWLTGTSFSSNGVACRYLEAAPVDQSTALRWNNGSHLIVFDIESNAIGVGRANTDAIIGIQGATETDYAAGLARAYNGGGKSDWYLPSKDELHMMFTNLKLDNVMNPAHFANANYWSSSQAGSWYAYVQSFSGIGSQTTVDTNNTAYVRAVRAF